MGGAEAVQINHQYSQSTAIRASDTQQTPEPRTPTGLFLRRNGNLRAKFEVRSLKFERNTRETSRPESLTPTGREQDRVSKGTNNKANRQPVGTPARLGEDELVRPRAHRVSKVQVLARVWFEPCN